MVHPSSALFKVLPLPPWVVYHEGAWLAAGPERACAGADVSAWALASVQLRGAQRLKRPRCSSAR